MYSDAPTRSATAASYLSRAPSSRELVNILYQQAAKSRPEAAEEALRKEVAKAVEKDIWKGVLEQDLSPEERQLILPMMINYVEKYHPDATFDKSKVRVLVRGDMQREVGATEGPVCRVESILMLLSIAAFKGMSVFKVDVSSAYMNTPMSPDVKHRWVRLDPNVVKILQRLEPGKWDPFIRNDGRVLVEMTKLMYGYKEAAHYWNRTLVDVFLQNGYRQCVKDKCVLVKREGERLAICAITVDDCSFVCTKDSAWEAQQIEMLRAAFTEITTDTGDELGIIGIQVKMDREGRRVILSQKKFVDKVAEVFGTLKPASSPAAPDLMRDDDESPILEDQTDFRSKNSLLMFGATRTYPECKPAVIKLSTRYGKATKQDMERLRRVAAYIVGLRDSHRMVLTPRSLQLIASADGSYGENPDGTSNTGGCVGFESDDKGCWFANFHGKQPVVCKSACEMEGVAENMIGDIVEWAREFLEELGFPQKTVIMEVDSTCAIAMMRQGTGSFKRAKHIRIRWFWLKSLIDDGRLELRYRKGEDLVADVLTKPIVGARFWFLTEKLIGWAPEGAKD
jgi:hypothetical protein